eukprot:629314_1
MLYTHTYFLNRLPITKQPKEPTVHETEPTTSMELHEQTERSNTSAPGPKASCDHKNCSDSSSSTKRSNKEKKRRNHCIQSISCTWELQNTAQNTYVLDKQYERMEEEI